MRTFPQDAAPVVPDRRRLGGVTLLALLACLCVAGLEGWTVWQARDEQLAETLIKTDNLARAVAEHTTRSIAAVDLVIRGVVERLGHEGMPTEGGGRFAELLTASTTYLQQVLFFAILDEEGKWRATSRTELAPQNNADRPYFQFHRDHPEAGLHIGGLLKSRLDGRWVITASRSFKHADGRFGGIVLAVFDLDYFRRFYETLSIGQEGVIALADADSRLLIRQPMLGDTIGRILTNTQAMDKAAGAAESSNGLRKSSLDGTYRQYAFRRLPNLPLSVAAALSLDEELAGWRQRTLEHLVGVLAVCAILITLAVRFDGQIRRRKQADGEAVRANAKYRQLADSATDMIFRLDLDFVRRYVSPASKEILGYEAEELIDTKPVNMIHPDDAEGVGSTYLAMANGMERGSVTNRIRHRDGRWIWVEVTLRLIRDAAGAPSGIMGALRDISERRQLIDALTDARNAADEANQAKSAFLASMSHEIRTPMNGVIGFTDMLLDGELNQEQRRNATLLKSAGKSLLTIINDILDISKIEAGKLDLEQLPICLAEIAEATVSILQPQAIAKGIALHTNIDRDLPSWVTGDPTRLRQILFNLMNNAIKFTGRGSVTLRALRETGSAGDRVRIEVSDTGIGIPSDKLDRLFQTFSQVDRSTSRQYGGTGLGLAICKHLAEAMGGEIGVDSRPGDGSTFWFTVPIEACAAPNKIETRGRHQPATAARVLVAEDLYMNQIIIEALLRGEGHEVELVTNGAEAVDAVQRSDFDLVLMDMQMPVMDGIQATRMIRGLNERVRSIPIIALTANAMTEDISACLAAGMNDHLAKPIDRQALSRIVGEWTGRGTRSTAALPPAMLAPLNATVLQDLENRLGKDKVVLFVSMFRDQLVKTMAAITAAADPETVVREAHTLISISGNLGFTELMTRSRELMEAAKRKVADVSGLITILEAAAGRAQSAMNTRYPTP